MIRLVVRRLGALPPVALIRIALASRNDPKDRWSM